MKRKNLVVFVVAALLVWLVGLATTQQTAAQTQVGDNLLVNPGFENGHHHQDGISEITVPDGWRLHWFDGNEFPGSAGPAFRPESVNWFIGDAPPDEQSLFFRDGSFALKVFKGGAPVYAALSQDVNGLEVGRRYRLVVPIYIDIVADYSGGVKKPPAKLDSGQVRLGAGPVGAPWRDESQIQYSGWWTAETVNPFYLSYPVFVYDFTATQASMTMWIEMASKDPYPNNGFFLDALGLYALDEVDNTASAPTAPAAAPVSSGPPPTPFPTPTPRADGAIIHIVQVGDSLWSIAIQYASSLGVTPEQALATIRELNNNPGFIRVGQEILVSAPGEAPPPAEDAAPAGGGDEATNAGETATAEAPSEAEATQVPEATPEATAVPEVQPEPTAADLLSMVCVSAFNDGNSNGVRDAGSEGLLADAVFTLSRASNNVASYVTDGINEPYCFENLEADTYQVTFSQPPEYVVTTSDNWAVAVSNGASIQVEFGARQGATAVAAVDNQAPDSGQAEAPAEAPANDDGGFLSNIGLIVIAVAVLLVVLAGVGVFLLRRA